MNGFKKTSIFSTLLLGASLLLLSAPADATPTLYSMLAYDGTWNVTPGWTDCYGNRTLQADAWGYDSSGNLICSAATQVTGTWTINTGSCAGAVTHVGHVRSNFLVDCTVPSASWTTQNNCVYVASAHPIGSGTCSSHTFVAYVEGVN